MSCHVLKTCVLDAFFLPCYFFAGMIYSNLSLLLCFWQEKKAYTFSFLYLVFLGGLLANWIRFAVPFSLLYYFGEGCFADCRDVTMVAILSAGSHSGLVVQGQMLFKNMQCVYSIAPRLELFSCMADLFGRTGLLNKAKEVITTMPFTPTPAMWATLIGACRIHGKAEMGVWAAEKLLEMRPQNPGYYVLIANMYAAAGSWSKLAKIRTFMRDLGVRKEAGCAWDNVGAEFSPFFAEDTTNSQSDEMYVLLGGLIKQMKDADCSTSEDSASDEELFCGRA
ncbi:hypothetical protein M9H77_33071 [Catharanthus roseus]|uniref:Uncharacterized protein n=1 Tax=Catharanthus roseus TaxID=4058 RepID=A0ACB9ZJU5_CATRO|nr:hypothetical protein M9H77_33071 [Catharanthus roseus]